MSFYFILFLLIFFFICSIISVSLHLDYTRRHMGNFQLIQLEYYEYQNYQFNCKIQRIGYFLILLF